MEIWPVSIKMFGAAGLLVGLVLLAQSNLYRLEVEDTTVDQGERGLIVVGTSGGSKNYKLAVQQHVDREGNVSVLFSVHSDRVDFDRTESGTEPINLRVAFVGDGFEGGVTCGSDSDPIPTSETADLYQGMRVAIETYDSDHRSEGGNVQSYPQTVLEYATTLYLDESLANGVFASRTATENAVWTEACALPREAVWRLPAGEEFESSDRRSLLPAQINWTSIDAKTDFHEGMLGRISIDRPSGFRLVEGYPEPETLDDGWQYDGRQFWRGTVGSEQNIGRLDEPLFIFADRASAERSSQILLLFGAGLGLGGALSAAILSRLVDLTFALAAHRRRP